MQINREANPTEGGNIVVNPIVEVPIEKEILEINGVVRTIVKTEQTKGRGKGNLLIYIEQDLSELDYFLTMSRIFGEENVKREFAGLVREWCRDATADVIAKSKDGIFTDQDWIQCLLQQPLPSTRRIGHGVKQYRAKLKEVNDVLTPLMFRKVLEGNLTPEEDNQLLQLMAEYTELGEKIDKSSRKGKKKS